MEKINLEKNNYDWSSINTFANTPDRPMIYHYRNEERFSVSKELIIRAIENQDREELIKYSNYFYRASSIYVRMVDYMANLLTFSHVIYPSLDSGADEVEKVNGEYFNRFSLEGLGKEVALGVVRDGIFVACERVLDDSIVFQVLPPAFCRMKAKAANGFVAEFNFSFFEQFDDAVRDEIIAQFPEEFAALYSAYQSDSAMMWGTLPPEYTLACQLSSDLPLFGAVLVDILEYEDSKKLDRLQATQKLTKLLVQKPPLNKETNKPTIPAKELTTLHSNLRRTVQSQGITVLTTPCDVDALDLAGGYQGKDEATYAQKALDAVYNHAGIPAVLFASNSISGTVLQESISIDAATILPILNQLQTWFNTRLAGLNYSARVIFPPATINNYFKLTQEYTGLAKEGYPTKLLALACLNIDTTAAKGLGILEDSVDWKESSGGSSYDPANPRAKKDPKDLTDEGSKTREGEKNDD